MFMRAHFRPVLLAAVCVIAFTGAARAACPGTPLTNGTTADATQVMSWLDCKAPLGSPSFTGNVGIGKVNPTTPLWVTTPSDTLITLESTAANGRKWELQSTVPGNFEIVDRTGNVNRILINASGYVGIGNFSPAQLLDVGGTIRQSGCTTAGTLAVNGSGDIICSSDARLKNIRGHYTGGLEEIARINPVLFVYKPTKQDPNETFVHAGFTAQNVKAAIPQASALQRDGYYSLDTTAILAASVNAIKELDKRLEAKDVQINGLEAQLKKQAAQNISISSRLEELERRGKLKTASR